MIKKIVLNKKIDFLEVVPQGKKTIYVLSYNNKKFASSNVRVLFDNLLTHIHQELYNQGFRMVNNKDKKELLKFAYEFESKNI